MYSFMTLDCNWIEKHSAGFLYTSLIEADYFCLSFYRKIIQLCNPLCEASLLRSKHELKSCRNGNEIVLNMAGPLNRGYRKLSRSLMHQKLE